MPGIDCGRVFVWLAGHGVNPAPTFYGLLVASKLSCHELVEWVLGFDRDGHYSLTDAVRQARGLWPVSFLNMREKW